VLEQFEIQPPSRAQGTREQRELQLLRRQAVRRRERTAGKLKGIAISQLGPLGGCSVPVIWVDTESARNPAKSHRWLVTVRRKLAT
jgi:hypothetical protein